VETDGLGGDNGALTFAYLKEMVKLRLGNNAAWSAAGDSSLDYYGIWVNSAYRMLCTQDKVLGLPKKLYFPELLTSTTKTTTDGTAYVTVPSDVLYITEVYDTTHNVRLTTSRGNSISNTLTGRLPRQRATRQSGCGIAGISTFTRPRRRPGTL